jgi:hypothetical protein
LNSQDHLACVNCALPSNCLSTPGRKIAIQSRPENGFQKERKRTVWVCTDECAHQALAIAKYGPSTHKWPIRLAQFRAMNPLRPISGQTVTKTIAETRINSGSEDANFPGRLLPHHDLVSVTPKGRLRRKGGRPRTWRSEAEGNRQRQRAYRAAQRAIQEVTVN